ncbi:ras GEF [Panus rudis PR-1116 ss-1]|nr:ras GEF [Panus rudis PR-1116 ss-1]
MVARGVSSVRTRSPSSLSMGSITGSQVPSVTSNRPSDRAKEAASSEAPRPGSHTSEKGSSVSSRAPSLASKSSRMSLKSHETSQSLQSSPSSISLSSMRSHKSTASSHKVTSMASAPDAPRDSKASTVSSKAPSLASKPSRATSKSVDPSQSAQRSPSVASLRSVRSSKSLASSHKPASIASDPSVKSKSGTNGQEKVLPPVPSRSSLHSEPAPNSRPPSSVSASRAPSVASLARKVPSSASVHSAKPSVVADEDRRSVKSSSSSRPSSKHAQSQSPRPSLKSLQRVPSNASDSSLGSAISLCADSIVSDLDSECSSGCDSPIIVKRSKQVVFRSPTSGGSENSRRSSRLSAISAKATVGSMVADPAIVPLVDSLNLNLRDAVIFLSGASTSFIAQRPVSPAVKQHRSCAQLSFDKDKNVVAASLPALISYLTDPSEISEESKTELLDTLFIFFRSITSANRLFELLVQRYKEAPPKDLRDGDALAWKRNHSLTKIQVVIIMQTWLKYHWVEDLDGEVRSKIISFTHNTLANDTDLSSRVAKVLAETLCEYSAGRMGRYAPRVEQYIHKGKMHRQEYPPTGFESHITPLASLKSGEISKIDATFFMHKGGSEELARAFSALEWGFFQSFSPPEIARLRVGDSSPVLDKWEFFSETLYCQIAMRLFKQKEDAKARAKVYQLYVEVAMVRLFLVFLSCTVTNLTLLVLQSYAQLQYRLYYLASIDFSSC